VARLLAQALLAVGAVIDPEIIVIGGGIGSRAELFERVRALLSTVPVALRVEPSALGTRAVVIGALSHAVQSIWQPAESAGERGVPAWPSPQVAHGLRSRGVRSTDLITFMRCRAR
jgi:predicted NBD/HSP70 family sugar kinase